MESQKLQESLTATLNALENIKVSQRHRVLYTLNFLFNSLNQLSHMLACFKTVADMHAFLILQERLQGSAEEEMPPQKEELEAVFGQAIANLNAQLNNVVEAPKPQEQQQPEANGGQIDVSCCG